MNLLKKIDALLTTNGYQKATIKKQVQYVKVLNSNVEYIFTYAEEKSKYGAGAPSSLLLECAVRFTDIEELLQKNNREFLIAQGWKPEHFDNYRKYSCFIKEFYNGDVDRNKLDEVYKEVERSALISFDFNDINRLKNNIRNFEVTKEFPESRQENIVIRALILAHLDGKLDNLLFENEFARFANNDIQYKEMLIKLKDWLMSTK